MKKIVTVTLIVGVAAATSACTPHPDQVSATYVSPSTYDRGSCNKLRAERNEIAAEVKALTDDQKEAANTDTAIVTASVLLLPLGMVMLSTTEDKSEALASAKGNLEAIEKTMTTKGCSS